MQQDQPSPLQLAQAAYRAYGGYTGGVTYNGRLMPAWVDLGPTVQGAWIAAAGAVERDLHTTTVREESTVTLPPYDPGDVAGEAGTIAPTQTRHPWRAVIRTIFAGAVAVVPVVVDVLGELHLGGTVVGGTSLVVLGGVTRVLALPSVDAWLTDYLPWLAAEPRQP